MTRTAVGDRERAVVLHTTSPEKLAHAIGEGALAELARAVERDLTTPDHHAPATERAYAHWQRMWTTFRSARKLSGTS